MFFPVGSNLPSDAGGDLVPSDLVGGIFEVIEEPVIHSALLDEEDDILGESAGQ